MLDRHNDFFENSSKRERFALICCELLNSTFINRYVVENDGDTVLNENYLFIRENFEVFEEYLSLSGWEINVNNSRGVIYIRNIYEKNKAKFKKNVTIAALMLRYMYDRGKAEAGSSDNVTITPAAIIRELINMKKLDKRLAEKEMRDIIKIFTDCNILCLVKKGDSFFENLYMIMGGITVAVNDNRILDYASESKEEDITIETY